ncbi:DUF4325 domain-containing protein [Patescibacteria group bacterium]|nr:DUF4325 domain-containing protein [Patescibacteria group bacterium]
MIISISKFGTVLSSRQSGKEAYAAFAPTLAGVTDKEELVVDFDGVSAFSPSWGDEFLTPLQVRFGKRMLVKNTTNPSVALTLTTLEKMNGTSFSIERKK